MREGWEYKKLGEVCEVVTGSTPKTNIPEYWGDVYPWVTPSELKGETYIKDTERHITDEAVAHTNLILMPIGTVLLSSRAPIGKVAITETEMYCNQGFKNLICSKAINNKYLYLWLNGKTDYLNSLGRGATFKEISRSIVQNIEIPLPPLTLQQSIVSELDEINNLLSLKRKELETYDKLAQSLFYEMFGDPVQNEKGWEVRKLGEVCELKAGKAIKAIELSEDNKFPCYGGNGIRGFINKCSHHYSAPVIGRQGAYCGTVNFANAPFYATEHAVVVKSLIAMDLKWLFYTLIKLNLSRFAKGQAQPGIAVGNLNEYVNLPLPPLPLQQLFATRIEAIEEQKANVKTAIEKLETLLAARMQYWFD